MKNRKCPLRKHCYDHKDDNCNGCEIGDEITKLHKRIDRLKKQNENLTIQRNAWFLTAKAMESKWIPVEERLPDPKEYDWVLVNVMHNEDSTYGVPHIAECRNGEWWDLGYDVPMEDLSETVTHWMPLPEPPKGVTE